MTKVRRPRAWALVAGGGTAGHALPGISAGRALVAAGHPVDSIRFVGSRRGVEARLVPEAGFELTLLPGRGIQRKVSLANVGAVFGLLAAILQAFVLVGRLRPKVVLALGGYASVPCALAAVVWRVPIVVAEQNAAPGAANRLVSRFAKACAVAFPGTPLPRAVVTGNPVRPEVVAVGEGGRDAKARARAALGVPAGRRVILVFGGSLGALRLNEAAVTAATAWAERSDLALRHVVGTRDWELYRARCPELPAGGLVYQQLRYDDDMPTSLAAADVAVTRSGSSTCFELAAAGIPAVLVPSPHVTADHQTANARVLVDAGAARMVPDDELDGARLVSEIDALLGDARTLDGMARAMRAWAIPDAAARVAAVVEEHARG